MLYQVAEANNAVSQMIDRVEYLPPIKEVPNQSSLWDYIDQLVWYLTGNPTSFITNESKIRTIYLNKMESQLVYAHRIVELIIFHILGR